MKISTFKTLTTCGILAASIQVSAQSQSILLIGAAPEMEQNDEDEVAAYTWAMANYDATYASFQDIVMDAAVLDGHSTVWWHYDSNVALPLIAQNPVITGAIESAHAAGASIMLTGLATQYVVYIGLDDIGPGEVSQAAEPFTNPDPWGFLPANPVHPVFNELSAPFFTLYSETGLREDSKAWWGGPVVDWYEAQGGDFGGTLLASTEWDANFDILMTLGEYESDGTTGTGLVCGAGAFDWYLEGGENDNADDLVQLTKNMLDYCIAESNVSGTPDNVTERNQLGVSVYPNPFAETVNFGLNANGAPAELQIFNAVGALVHAETLSVTVTGGRSALTWDADVEPGMYHYVIQCGDQTAAGRIIAQ